MVTIIVQAIGGGDGFMLLDWIIQWYFSKCDGQWEHEYGVNICTIDNPGWMVEIDILETELEDKQFTPIEIENSETDWLRCKVADGKFLGYGDPNKLLLILGAFKKWYEETVY